jgi:hypothetical protein
MQVPVKKEPKRKKIIFDTCPFVNFESPSKINNNSKKYEIKFVGIPSSRTTSFM